VTTNPKTKTTRYVHTSRQAAFDSQSLPEARYLPYAKDWPTPIGAGKRASAFGTKIGTHNVGDCTSIIFSITLARALFVCISVSLHLPFCVDAWYCLWWHVLLDLEYAAPGAVVLRRDAWRVVKPPPVPLGVKKYAPGVGPKGRDVSNAPKPPLPLEVPLSPKSPKAAAAAAAKSRKDAKTSQATAAKEAAAAKKKGAKGGAAQAVAAAPDAQIALGPVGLREDRYL
jgi:hypothetical protein